MSAFLLSTGTIAFSQSGGLIMDAWKVQGNNVLKKDTSGNVGIGTINPQEKLHVKGDVRIDGLKGSGEHWLYADEFGRVRKGPPKEGGGRPPIVIVPDEGGKPGCYPAPDAWCDGFETLWLDPQFNYVGMGFANPPIPFSLWLQGKSPVGTDPNVLLLLRNINNSAGLNQPTILFDNGDDGAGNESWSLGGTVSGTRYFSIGRNALGSYHEFFRIEENGKVNINGDCNINGGLVGIGNDAPKKMLHITSLRNNSSETQNGLRLEDKNSIGQFSTWDFEPFAEDGSLKLSVNTDGQRKEVMNFTKNGSVNFLSSGMDIEFLCFCPLVIPGLGSIDIFYNHIHLFSPTPRENSSISIVFGNTNVGDKISWDIGYKANNGYGPFSIGYYNKETNSGAQVLNISEKGVGIGHYYQDHEITSPLTVNGIIETTHGIKFPDGIIQTEAAQPDKINYWIKNSTNQSLSYTNGPIFIGKTSGQSLFNLTGNHSATLDEKLFEINFSNTDDILSIKTYADGYRGNAKLNFNGDVSINGNLSLGTSGSHLCLSPTVCLGSNHGFSGGAHYKSTSGNFDLILESSSGYIWDIISGDDGVFTLASFQTLALGDPTWIKHLTIDRAGNFKYCGIINSRKIIVDETLGCDFVFGVDYKLPSLDEVEQYIKENEHLPNIPSATEMKKNGVDVGDLQMKLLQKVEELTLYTIDLKKSNDQKDKIILSIMQRIEELERENSKK